MRTPFSALMQSKFFTPSFNTAIFDEPVRIYFSQMHESFALKIYFNLEDRLGELLPAAKEISRKTGQTLMVMIYPNGELFQNSFPGIGTQAWLASEMFGGDIVVGVNGPREDADLNMICETIKSHLTQWTVQTPARHLELVSNEI